jgi:zinc transport system substrate-binding protein
MLIITAALFSPVALFAGGQSHTSEKGERGVAVVTTIFAPYDFARQIGGDAVNLTMLLPPGSESHSYEPSPRDIITIRNSDIFIYVGGESDSWVDRILSSMDTSGKKVIKLMDCVSVVEEVIVEGMEDDEHDHHDHEHEEGEEHEHEEHAEYDEHVWTSPANAVLIVEKIARALCEKDPSNADFYMRNAADYIAQLNDLDAAFQRTAANGARKTIVFGDRFPFRYFCDRYGLDYYAAFPGCSTETEPSAATVAFLINKIKTEKIPVVFHIELSNDRMCDTISAETASGSQRGAKKMLLHACHNVSKADFERGATYLELMTRNVDALREALY